MSLINILSRSGLPGILAGAIRIPSTLLTSSAAISVNFANGPKQRVVLDHNATFTYSGLDVGDHGQLIIEQGSTGGTGAHSGVTWGDGGTAPTLSVGVGKKDVIDVENVNGVYLAARSWKS